MKKFLSEQKFFWLFLLIYFLCELIVRPHGEFPLNDDWSYTKSVLEFANTGKINIGDWPAMTLATHIIWGFLFVKIFGFSFFILRCSTWVSAIVLFYVLNGLVFKITRQKMLAFICCLTLLFNPVFFNVSNTFMTDVNFLTLLFIGVYFCLDFLESKKSISLLLAFLISAALVLLRQYGIIVPAALCMATLVLKENKWKYFLLASLGTAIIYGILLYYESYLKTIISPEAAYRFSGNFNPTRRLFWENLLYGISTRYKIVAIHCLFYTLPFTVMFLPNLLSKFRAWVVLLIFVLCFTLIYFLYKTYPLQVGNVFLDTAVGTDTTYETLVGTYVGVPHFYSKSFNEIAAVFKYLFMSLALSLIVLCTIDFVKNHLFKNSTSLKLKFVVVLFAAYVVVILITESFFDRYQLPVIGISLLIFAFLGKLHSAKPVWCVIPLFLLFYVSVFGTRDYFTLNRVRWNAYRDLVDVKKVEPSKIHGSFETVNWNEGHPAVMYDFALLHKFDYVIQFHKEDSFALYKELPFKRCFPFKKDTLRIFKREIFAQRR